jgi:hypothetical protein
MVVTMKDRIRAALHFLGELAIRGDASWWRSKILECKTPGCEGVHYDATNGEYARLGPCLRCTAFAIKAKKAERRFWGLMIAYCVAGAISIVMTILRASQ